MSKAIRKKTEDLEDNAVLVIKAMFLIVIVYMVAETLFGMVPTLIGSIIIGLSSVYIYTTNNTVRRQINSWAKKQKFRSN